MTALVVIAAILAVLVVSGPGRSSRGTPAGRRWHAGLTGSSGPSRSALVKGGLGLAVLVVALLGPGVARLIT